NSTAFLTDYNFIQYRLGSMLGRILTIIDASIADGRQNKAIKDLIKSKFVDEYAELSSILYDNNWMRGVEENATEADIVNTDEALGIK
ncbi:MAG: hypothetical protein WC679_13615, partial [Bacteroidales bacterium]